MSTLTESIADLATRLREDRTLVYLQASIERERAAIEAILERGVSIRKLALALSDAGVCQADGRPLSHGHLRQLITRARRSADHAADHDRRDPSAPSMRTAPSNPKPTVSISGRGTDAVERPSAPDFSRDPLGLRRGR